MASASSAMPANVHIFALVYLGGLLSMDFVFDGPIVAGSASVCYASGPYVSTLHALTEVSDPLEGAAALQLDSQTRQCLHARRHQALPASLVDHPLLRIDHRHLHALKAEA